jgi:hypothetical protein
MSNNIELRLDGDDVIDFSITGRKIWLKTEQYETIVRIPTTTKASCWYYGDRAVLYAGSVQVSGPKAVVEKLWRTIVEAK